MSELIETKEERLFLQLTIAKSHNKELSMEVGMLQSEKEELKHEISKLKEKIKIISAPRPKIERSYKHELYFLGIKETMNQLLSKVSTGKNIEIDELKDLIDKSFQKWSPLKRKNDIQQQESLLKKQFKQE